MDHGFYVRELRVQQDIVPGMEIPLHFTPTKLAGTTSHAISCVAWVTTICGLSST